jgi:hypothetical protein
MRFFEKMMTDEFHTYLRENLNRITYALKIIKAGGVSSLDSSVRVIVMRKLLLLKRKQHAVEAEERYLRPPDVQMNDVTVDEVRRYVRSGVNPFNSRLTEFSVQLKSLMIAKKKNRYSQMQVLSLLEPEEMTEALLAYIDLSEVKRKQGRRRTSKNDNDSIGVDLKAVSRSQPLRNSFVGVKQALPSSLDHFISSSYTSVGNGESVNSFTGAADEEIERERKENEKYAQRFGRLAFKGLAFQGQSRSSSTQGGFNSSRGGFGGSRNFGISRGDVRGLSGSSVSALSSSRRDSSGSINLGRSRNQAAAISSLHSSSHRHRSPSSSTSSQLSFTPRAPQNMMSSRNFNSSRRGSRI